MKIYAFADEASPMIDGQIKALLENELQGVEVRNVDAVNVADITLDKAREAKEKFDKAGLRVWSIGSPMGKSNIEDDDFEKQTEKFKHTLEIAKIMGAENIRLFSFFTPADKDPAQFKDEVIRRLKVWAEIAEGSGVTLCHENEKGIYGDTPERCLDIVKSIPSIKAIFDPANFVQCGVDTLKAWEIINPYVKYLHIKDALADSSVVPAGKGIGNIQYIVGEYIKKGGDAVTLEPHLTVFDGLAALENEGDKSVVGNVYHYASNEEAFAAAATAFKSLL